MRGVCLIRRPKALLTASFVTLAAAMAPAAAGAVDINGGSSWGGWTNVGNSLQVGIWGSGSTTRSFDIFTSVFTFNNNLITSNPDQVRFSGAPAGFAAGPYSNGAFTVGNTILGIGLAMTSPASPVGDSFVSFAMGPDRFNAASSLGASDGKVSLSQYGKQGDFSTWIATANGPSQLSVLKDNGTAQGGSGTISTLPGGIGSGTGYDFAFRVFKQGTEGGSVQFFFDLTAMQTLYGLGGSLATNNLTGVGTSICSGGAWPCGAWSLPNGASPIGAFGDTLTLSLYNSNSAHVNAQTVTFSVPLQTQIPVPAPAALSLLAVGLIGLALTRRRWREADRDGTVPRI
jgi:hypothetical protein